MRRSKPSWRRRQTSTRSRTPSTPPSSSRPRRVSRRTSFLRDAREWVERHGIPPEDLVDLAMRAMKLVANTNEWWRERINDLRFRLGDVAAS